MFVARMALSTLMSGVRFEVVAFDGSVAVVTRSAAKAVRVAALMNAGEAVTSAVLFG
jgi:hypothetical protein